MKRLGEILYGEKAPEAQASLWLKRIDPFTTVPHIIDNKQWKPIKILDSKLYVDTPVFYIKSNTKIASLETFLNKENISTTKKSNIELFSGTIYFYIAICTKDILSKVVTEYGENITDAFIKIDTGIIPFNNNVNKEYNLYEFAVRDSLTPLEASIKIILNDEND